MQPMLKYAQIKTKVQMPLKMRLYLFRVLFPWNLALSWFRGGVYKLHVMPIRFPEATSHYRFPLGIIQGLHNHENAKFLGIICFFLIKMLKINERK